MTDSSTKALFKIERRQVLEQRREEKKKLSAPIEARTVELVIGTQSSCGLHVDDPIAAATHCAISFRTGRFMLHDLGGATGTFLNGERVLEPLPVGDGDRITLGVTTIEVSQDRSVADTLSLAVHEGAFFHTAKKRGEFASDADEWVRSEVTFGRTPWLVALNVLTIALFGALAVWLWSTPDGQSALQPGPLSGVHARLFSADPPTEPHLAFMVEIAAEQGCSACHDSSGTPTANRCASCHKDLVQAAKEERAHPFIADDALDCLSCHKEHFGAVPPPDTLRPTNIAGRCVDCHGEDFSDEAAVREGIAHAVGEYGLVPSTMEPLALIASLGYEAFDHARHVEAGDCATCHELDESRPVGFEFAPVTFETCMACHAEDADVEVVSQRPGEEFRWSTTWHGASETEATCSLCHAEVFDGALATVERSDAAPTVFTLLTRTHHSFLDGSEGPGDCATCHKSGAVRMAQQTLDARAFRHDQHLTALQFDGDASRALANEQCAECHTDMANSSALVAAPDSYDGPPIVSCATCHDEEGVALISVPGVASAGTTERRTANFPHDRHTIVEGGCVTCHAFDAAGPDGFPLPSTPADVVTCVRCHIEQDGGVTLGHASIGGGDCAACHEPRGTVAAATPMAAVFYGADQNDAPAAPSTFPHALEAHQQRTCVECHGDPGEVGDVHSPSVTAASCRECHAQTRFHWR